jgi:predicted Zn-dependent protease
MTRTLHRLLILLVLPVSLTLAGCAQVVNPATGQREYTTLSPAQETQIGREQHPSVLQEFGGEYRDPALQAYVSEIGQRLKSVSEMADQEFTFTLLNSDMVNAFALPGGYVYITRGLMALAENEAEVAGVLGHEIGHVTARHTAQRHTRATQAGILATLGTIGAAVLGGRAAGELAQQVGTVGAQAWVASYSRDQELEADRLGIRYLRAAGYDPQAMASFLQKLDQQSELERRLAGTPEGGLSWFATHPRTLERVELAVAEVGGAGSGRLGRDDYLRRIDGLIWGDDPAQGLVQGSTFVHPELRFAFTAPAGFQLQNTPSAVFGRGRDGASFQFDLARVPAGADLRDHVASWARELGAQRLDRLGSTQVSGLPAAYGSTVGQTQGGRVAVHLGAIRAEGDNVYRFLVLEAPGSERAFRTTFESFRRLGAEEAAAVRPQRVRVVEVGPGDTPQTLASRMALDAPEEQFRILNHLALQGPLRSGERVKLVTG